MLPQAVSINLPLESLRMNRLHLSISTGTQKEVVTATEKPVTVVAERKFIVMLRLHSKKIEATVEAV
jgi:hypothetical protein